MRLLIFSTAFREIPGGDPIRKLQKRSYEAWTPFAGKKETIEHHWEMWMTKRHQSVLCKVYEQIQIETYLSKSTNALFLWVRRPFCFDWNVKTKTSGFLPKNTRYFFARVLIFISAVQISVWITGWSQWTLQFPAAWYVLHGFSYTFITKSKGSTECKFT